MADPAFYVLQAMFDVTGQRWMDEGLCAQTDPEEFFADKGGSTRLAKRVCRRCPVRRDCLRFAMEHSEKFGVWGGTSERERRHLRARFGDDADAAVVFALRAGEDVAA